jgi:hypothetical protein
VRYVAARATRPVAVARGSLTFLVAADGRRYHWSVRRLGSQRTLARGSSRSRTLSVPVRTRRAGIAVLTVRVGAHRHATPFGVQARRRARVLVVLPETTWQARNPVEGNGDGYPDRLPPDKRASVLRPYAGDGLPPGFAGDTSSLLRFLDESEVRYDITTDLLLTRTRGSSLERYRGVLFAGAPRFSTAAVERALRTYVESGGRLAGRGRGGFAWTVSARRAALLAPRRNRRAALFGERLRAEPEAVPTAVLVDRIGFFREAPGPLPPFGPLEESLRLPRGATLLSSAGTGADRSAIVVYRRERGIVARIGIDGFGRALRTSPAAERIMRRLWVLLSR